MNILLDEWQREVLNHDGNILLCTGRQVGKTTILAIKACEFLIKKPQSKIIVVSLTEDQAQIIISMAYTYLTTKYSNQVRKQNRYTNKTKITLRNNSQILARPVGSTGDAVRGFTGDVLIIDEASRHPQYVFDAAKPVLLTTGGQLWVCSTPAGKSGYFYECHLNKYGRFKVFHISSEEVILNRKVQGIWTEKRREEALRLLDEEKKDMGELAYAQEYLGMFVDDLKRYFTDELIEKCCIRKRPNSLTPGIYFLGVDIARMGEDEGTFEILQKTQTKTIQIENIVTKKKKTYETEQNIISLDRLYNFSRIGIDAGAGTLGVSIYDHLLLTEVGRKLDAINSRARSLKRDDTQKTRLLKEDLFENLRAMMEREEIELLDDDNLKESLRSITWEEVRSPNKQTIIKISGSYDHIADGLIRAAWYAKSKNLNIWVKSIRV